MTHDPAPKVYVLLFLFLLDSTSDGHRTSRVPISTNSITMNRPNTSGSLDDPLPDHRRLSTNVSRYAIKSPSQMGLSTSNLSGIRIRLNDPVFSETSRLFLSVFGNQVQSVQIANYQQCFQEGCFFLHSFRISGFQKPQTISFRPMQPNKLLLNIFAFDVDIVGLINGNLQILLNVPVAGQVVANARQITVTAEFDLQKDQHKIPYLRVENCALRSGYVNAQVLGMGLITDSVNLKYRKEMVDKAREVISMTICSNIDKTIRDQVNQRLKRDMPKHISLYELFQYLDHTAPDVQPRPVVARESQSSRQYRTEPSFRQKRRVDMKGVGTVVEILTDELHGRSRSRSRSPKSAKFRQDPTGGGNQIVDEKEKKNTNNVEINQEKFTKRLGSRSATSDGWKNSSMKSEVPTRSAAKMDVAGLKGFLDVVDMNSLARLFVNLDLLDSVSLEESFTIGMDGTILLNASPYSGPYGDPPDPEDVTKLQFPTHVTHRSLEVVVGEFTPNSLFQQAHRAKILRFHLKNNTPLFGKMLKTSCTPDEVCISDSIPEIGEKYPNKLLDIVVESVRPPRLVIGEDELRVMMIGLATFYLTESRHQIGKIPFSSIVLVGCRTVDKVLHGTVDYRGKIVVLLILVLLIGL